MQERELKEEGRSLKTGLWCFLFTATQEDDRLFFDKYAEYVDESSTEDWHCIGFARKVDPLNEKDKGWRADNAYHQTSEQIRFEIRQQLITPNDIAFVFFNPYLALNNGEVFCIAIKNSRLYERKNRFDHEMCQRK